MNIRQYAIDICNIHNQFRDGNESNFIDPPEFIYTRPDPIQPDPTRWYCDPIGFDPTRPDQIRYLEWTLTQWKIVITNSLLYVQFFHVRLIFHGATQDNN